ncbi:MAG: protease modulator HflC [Alphaproteobacteria bacterium]
MKKHIVFTFAILALTLIVISQSLFIVDQREQAIVLQLGNPVGNADDTSNFIKGPGLHAKLPFIQNVRYFDRRILSADPPPAQVVISSNLLHALTPRPVSKPATTSKHAAPSAEPAGPQLPEPAPTLEDGPVIENVTGEPIIVDTFVRYQIIDPLQFLKTLRTVENADSRLINVLNDATRAVLGQTTLQELLSSDRDEIMSEIRDRVNRKIEEDRLGIKVVDVRIVRADLTPELGTSTVRRMISELKERATETRAKGEERALEIRSTADKERSVLLADANRDAQIIKGEGDNEAIKLYTAAFNKDKDFYKFTRTMEAYRNVLGDPETQMILSPQSDFLHYLEDSSLR